MNTNSRYKRNSSLWLIVAINIIAILMFSANAQANRIITGCDEGSSIKDVQYFPSKKTVGEPNHRKVNWEIGLNDGIYTISVTSWYDFRPWVYKMSGGKYKGANRDLHIQIKRLKTRNGKYFYAVEFTVNHMNSRGVNMWRLLMEPKEQNRRQKMYLWIKHKRCPQSTGGGLERPGEEEVDNPRPFGQNY